MNRFDDINREAARAARSNPRGMLTYARRATRERTEVYCGRPGNDCQGRLGFVDRDNCLNVLPNRLAPRGHKLEGRAIVARGRHGGEPSHAGQSDIVYPFETFLEPGWPLTLKCPDCGTQNTIDAERLDLNQKELKCCFRRVRPDHERLLGRPFTGGE